MSSGKAHNTITKFAVIPTVIVTARLFDMPAALVTSLGCLSGIILTPDLDQEGINCTEWQIVKKSAGLGFLWLMFWYPYAMIIPHRHFLSHFPVISTLIRLIYVLFIPFVLSVYFGYTNVWYTLLPHIGYFFMGLCVSDTLHYLADILT